MIGRAAVSSTLAATHSIGAQLAYLDTLAEDGVDDMPDQKSSADPERALNPTREYAHAIAYALHRMT
jgi:hypothetical protein